MYGGRREIWVCETTGGGGGGGGCKVEGGGFKPLIIITVAKLMLMPYPW